MTTANTEPPRPQALVVLAHPDPQSFNHALARAVCAGLSAGGMEVRFHDLHAEGFDPVLTAVEARGKATADPLIQRHISELRTADVLAAIHPNCWGAPPAMMKGWMDRVFAPGAAYAFAKGEDKGDAPEGLLKARRALVLNTSNTTAEREALVFGDPLQRIWADCLLAYCGIPQVDRRVFRVIAASREDERSTWLAEAEEAARQAAAHVTMASG